MGTGASRRDETGTGHQQVPIDLINKVRKSICKITIKNRNSDIYGTGFFMDLKNSKKYLLTNYHVINPKENDDIEIEIYNGKKMKLDFSNNRYYCYLYKPKDIIIIEIKNYDRIFHDIKLLDYDMNYMNGYYQYIDRDVFTVGYPGGRYASNGSGTIKKISRYEFEHDISTEPGSSGSPILLLTGDVHTKQVIGIHKSGDKTNPINYGTFIGEIINYLNIKQKKRDRINSKNINNVDHFYENCIVLKVAFIGEYGVGKTSIIKRFVDGEFEEYTTTIIGLDIKIKILAFDEFKTLIKFVVFDTGGEERYRALTRNFYRGVDCLFIVYDVTNKESFEKVFYWYYEIRKNYSYGDPIIYLVANKCDLINSVDNEKLVKEEDAIDFARKNNYIFYKTSAKEGKGIDELFKNLGSNILNQKNKIVPENNINIKLGIDEREPINKKDCC